MIPAPNRVMFTIEDFPIFWYGVIVASAVFVCYLLIPKLITGDKKLVDKFQHWFGFILLVGFIGARLFEVFFYSPDYFMANPWQIVNTRLGGLSIFGGIIGAGAVLLLLQTYFKGKWLQIVDVVGVLAPLGQAIGRWGNYFNQELYGLPCTYWWCLKIDLENRLPAWQAFSSFHPTFLYESILLIVLFVFLWKQKAKIGTGYLVGVYLMGYGLIRFLVEFVRIDTQAIFGLKWPQLVALLMFFVGLFIYIYRNKKVKV